MPNPYLLTAPTLVYDFSDAPGSFTKFDSGSASGTLLAGGAGSVLAGTASLRIQTQGATGSSNTRAHINKTVDMTGTGSEDDLVSCRVKYEEGTYGEDLGEGSTIQMFFGADTSFSKYAIGGMQGDDMPGVRTEWNVVTQRKSDFNYIGGFTNADWANIQRIAVYIKNPYANGKPDYYGDVTFDSIWLGGTVKPARS